METNQPEETTQNLGSVGLATLGDDGEILTINSTAADLFGHVEEDMIGKTVLEFVQETEQFETFAELINTNVELTGLKKDGGVFPLGIAITELPDPSVGRLLAIIRDRTPFRKTKDALAASEMRYRSLFENANEGIVIRERESTEVIDCNQMFLNRLGYERDEIVGHKVEKFSPMTPDIKRIRRFQEAGYDSKDIVERTHLRKDGTEMPVEISSSPIEIDGRKMVVSFIRDITERRAIETQKSEFISTVSHELRTPLTSIKGALGLMRSGIVGEIPDKFAAMLDIAFNNSERLTRLINDILDIEKIEAGQLELNWRLLDLTSIVRETIEESKGYGDEFKVTIVENIKIEAASIEADPDRFKQVLSNLISNAVKFSPEGGEVTVSVEKQGDYFRISATDNGPGVPDNFRDKLFDKFSQVDSSDTRQVGGTGLGLSISKAIVEQHGGKISFTSDPNVETTFYFDLPTVGPLRLPHTPKPGNHKYKILICEDEPDIARLLDLILQQGGFDTEIAGDAAEAKKLIHANHFDAMTLDIALPGQDGISLIQELRQSPETKHLPILVVSAKAQEGKKRLNGEAFGIIDWMQKPIDEKVLVQRLKNALGASSDTRPTILHVEDDRDISNIVDMLLSELADVTIVRDIASAQNMLDEYDFDLIILDLVLPDGKGEEIIPNLGRSDGTKTPVIVFSVNEASQAIAVEIQSSLIKSQTTNEEIVAAVQSAIEKNR